MPTFYSQGKSAVPVVQRHKANIVLSMTAARLEFSINDPCSGTASFFFFFPEPEMLRPYCTV